jgi:hypothetical protein
LPVNYRQLFKYAVKASELHRNKALSGMLQAKLKLGKSNDPSEQEADKTPRKYPGS